MMLDKTQDEKYLNIYKSDIMPVQSMDPPDILSVIEKDGDKEKVQELKIFPSYVFIKMIMTDESWHAVRNITGVTGFVGPGSRPTPLTEQEVQDMNIEEVKVQLSFKVGDEVDVISGLFEGYSGVVTSISDDLKIVTVLVKRGRRDMPVELDSTMLKLHAAH